MPVVEGMVRGDSHMRPKHAEPHVDCLVVAVLPPPWYAGGHERSMWCLRSGSMWIRNIGVCVAVWRVATVGSPTACTTANPRAQWRRRKAEPASLPRLATHPHSSGFRIGWWHIPTKLQTTGTGQWAHNSRDARDTKDNGLVF